MKPDEKYMSEVKLKNNSDFTFTPPSFDRSLSMDNLVDENDNNDFLNLYPDQTERSELYCYYSIFGDCDKKNSKNYGKNKNRIPTPFDILRGLDLDFQETLESNKDRNDVDKIYSEIELKNPGLYESFAKYGVPDPICKVITKRLIKLTLLYHNKE